MTLKNLQKFVKNRFVFFVAFECVKDLLSAFTNILFSVLFSEIIIRITTGNMNQVLFLATIIVLIKLVEFLAFWIIDIQLQKIYYKNKHICKLEFYKFFFDRPVHELFSFQVGDTKEKLNDDFETIIKKYTLTYPKTITSMLSAIMYFIYLISMSKWIALIFVMISLVQILPPLLIRKYLQVNYDDCRDVEAELTDFVVRGYRAFLLIKLYRLDNWWKKKLAEIHKKYSKIGRKIIYTGTAENVLNDVINSILTYVTYVIIGLFVLKGIVTLDDGIQSIAISVSFFSLIKIMFEVVRDIAVIRTAENRLSESMSLVEPCNGHIKFGNINISNLTFSYDEKILISHLNLSINDTKASIIKGENGSGKTTLLYLIAGVLKNEEGEVSIDGIVSSALSSFVYPKELFFLTQEDAVFNFSAIEMFDMMLPEHMDEVMEIAKKFGLNYRLLSESKINELSGGERKKVFLSVAFATNPILMILDEPTNSLDIEGKMLLKELIRQRKGSTLLVTHDSVMDDVVDNIYDISKGVNDEHI